MHTRPDNGVHVQSAKQAAVRPRFYGRVEAGAAKQRFIEQRSIKSSKVDYWTANVAISSSERSIPNGGDSRHLGAKLPVGEHGNAKPGHNLLLVSSQAGHKYNFFENLHVRVFGSRHTPELLHGGRLELAP